MRYLLDTNVFAALSHSKPHRGVERAFISTPPSS
jgi:hypothetical protein